MRLPTILDCRSSQAGASGGESSTVAVRLACIVHTAVTIISVLGVIVAVHLRLIYMLERER